VRVAYWSPMFGWAGRDALPAKIYEWQLLARFGPSGGLAASLKSAVKQTSAQLSKFPSSRESAIIAIGAARLIPERRVPHPVAASTILRTLRAEGAWSVASRDPQVASKEAELRDGRDQRDRQHGVHHRPDESADQQQGSDRLLSGHRCQAGRGDAEQSVCSDRSRPLEYGASFYSCAALRSPSG
jgi:hypothetical protein